MGFGKGGRGGEGLAFRAGLGCFASGVRAGLKLLPLELPYPEPLPSHNQAKPRKRPFTRQLVSVEVWNELRRQDDVSEPP